MYSIGQIAKRFRLSRSTLLYYDSIGLLPVSQRTPSNYRVYSEADCQRLEQIRSYREAGLRLKSIKELLLGAKNQTVSLLETRIHELSGEIGKLREQQKELVRLLLNYHVQEHKLIIDNNSWQEIFSTAEFNDFDQWKWHREFEMTSPEQHRIFLESVGAPADKIAAILTWARSDYREQEMA